MPRVKVDYVVSFSSEDAEHPASNLVAGEVGRRWLCASGQPSCSVVLQLRNAVKISSVSVGTYQTALVEVLVGRSESPAEPFQVLVPSSVVQSPAEARRGAAAERVRSWPAETLAPDARNRRWDRLRVVCSQPYNKHCKYGLSFIHVFSEESPGEEVAAAVAAKVESAAAAPTTAVPARLSLPLDTFSSDEDEFRPGELFAQQKLSADTGAQIRQATSQVLNNTADSSIKLNRAAITKTTSRSNVTPSTPDVADRCRDSLLYTADDAAPRHRIDSVLRKHNLANNKTDHSSTSKEKQNSYNKTSKEKDCQSTRKQVKTKTDRGHVSRRERAHEASAAMLPAACRRTASGERPPTRRPAEERTHDDDEVWRRGPSSAPHELLAGVVFVLSGYENPRRARVRDAALAMGARYQRDWGPSCTHLVCAFPNTPKLRAVRGAAGGARIPIVRAEWVEECARTRRRLPTAWFATEPARLVAPPQDWETLVVLAVSEAGEESCDTDDEIERVRAKRRRVSSPPLVSPAAPALPPAAPASPPAAPASPPAASPNTSQNFIEFIKDEKMQASMSVVESDDGGSTDCDAVPTEDMDAPAVAPLPEVLAGKTFSVNAAGPQARLIARYITAYGGLVLQDAESEVDYVVCGGRPSAGPGGGPPRLRAAWLWHCHADRALVPVQPYIIT